MTLLLSSIRRHSDDLDITYIHLNYNRWRSSHFSHLNFRFCSCLEQGVPQPTQTSLRRLQDVLQRSWRLTIKQDVFTSSGKRRQIYDTLRTSNLWRLEDACLHCLENVQFMTSWKRLIYVVLKTSNLRCLENVWFTTSSEHLIYGILKTCDLRCLEDVWFTTSWRRHFHDVLKTSLNNVCVATS